MPSVGVAQAHGDRQVVACALIEVVHNLLPPTTRCISRLEPWTCVRTSFVRQLTDLPRMCRRRSTHERVGRGRRGWSHASVAVGLLPPATRRCRRARAPSLCRWHERRRAASVRRRRGRGELRQQRERQRGAADRRGEVRLLGEAGEAGGAAPPKARAARGVAATPLAAPARAAAAQAVALPISGASESGRGRERAGACVPCGVCGTGGVVVVPRSASVMR